MRLGERAREEEPEARARLAPSRRRGRTSRRSGLVLERGSPARSRGRGRSRARRRRRASTSTSPPRLRVLDRVRDQVVDELAQPLAHRRGCSAAPSAARPRAAPRPGRSPRPRPSRAGPRPDRRRRTGSRTCPPRSATCRARRRRGPRAGVVSSAITARNASRWSGRSSRQRACSVRAEPITAAIGLRSSCETSETKSARSAESRRSSSTVARSASYVRRFCTRRRDEPPEQRHELELLLPERRGLGPRRSRARRSSACRAAAARAPERGCRARAARPPPGSAAPRCPRGRPCVPVRDHLLQDRVRHGDRGARLQIVVGADARSRHHARAAALGKQDRGAVEGQQAAELADEGGERLVEVERRAERPRRTVRRLEQVDATAELVAQTLGLCGPLFGVVRLAALHVDEPADDGAERDRDDDPEHERVVADRRGRTPPAASTRARAGSAACATPATSPPLKRKKSAASRTTRKGSARSGWAGSQAKTNISAEVRARSVSTLRPAR